MAKYTQANQPLEIRTPLGKDALLLVGFGGREAISELFRFELELLAPKESPAAFDKLLGQAVTVRLTLADRSTRFFNGIVRRFSQGRRDEDFLHYRAEVVPQFWLWTKCVQTRVFQHLGIRAILKEVLQGLDVRFHLSGTYYPRDYCVQYGESDFAFASRLMEEEGISYFFQHEEGKHTLVIADSPAAYSAVPVRSTVIFDERTGGTPEDLRVTSWMKSQELRSGKYTLWDSCFELPDKNLEAQQPILDQVAAGKVMHSLKIGSNGKLEIYEFPGRYAQRFDGVDPGGADRAADLQKIFEDNRRTARLRMEEEALPALAIHGAGACGHFVPGHRFHLQRHFDADGEYLLTCVQHTANLGDAYRTGAVAALVYHNRFTCIPVGLPYRPARVTAKPIIQGPQTAVVVGLPGEEIFCDKYGRVKVQFPWDRVGKKNADSSCWIRVGQVAAGKGFGAVNLPRVGEEVIVAFLEGDPDQPIIVGVVYNAENMPPYKLPEQRAFTGIVHRSHRGAMETANEIRFENALGEERMLVHAETDLHHNVEHNHHVRVGGYHSEIIGKKVAWDQGKSPKPAARVGSGAGGGNPVETPTAYDTKKDPEGDNYPSVKDPAGRYTEIDGGADITVDNAGKSTFVGTTNGAGGQRTVVYGGNYTRIFGGPGSVGSENTFWQDGTVNQGGDGMPMTMANTTEINGDSQTTVNGNTFSTVTEDTTTHINGSKTTTVAKNVTTQIHGNRTTNVGALDNLIVDKAKTYGLKSSAVLGGSTSLVAGLSMSLALISMKMVFGIELIMKEGLGFDKHMAPKLLNVIGGVKSDTVGASSHVQTPAGVKTTAPIIGCSGGVCLYDLGMTVIK